MQRIERVDHDDRLLTIVWDDRTTTAYTWTWVQDHCARAVDPATAQRHTTVSSLPDRSAPVEVDVRDGEIAVSWSNGDTSIIPVAMLVDIQRDDRPERSLWEVADLVDATPSVTYEDVMHDDAALRDWLERFERFGFCLVTGTPASMGATETLARRIGYVRESIFGGMWDFQADLAMADTAYTNTELGPHTDGTYSHDAPGAQLLHCLAFDGEGGLSTMVDGFRLATEMKDRYPDHYDTLSRVAVPGRYVGDGAHLRAERPVFRHDRSGELVQVTFNNADRAPFLLPPDEMDAFYEAVRVFEELATSDRFLCKRLHPPGTALLFDNWRVLHGRTSYTGHRHLCGCYLNKEDVDSRLRTLRA